MADPQNNHVALRSNINKNVKYIQKDDYYEINFLDVTDLQVDSEDEIDDVPNIGKTVVNLLVPTKMTTANKYRVKEKSTPI